MRSGIEAERAGARAPAGQRGRLRAALLGSSALAAVYFGSIGVAKRVAAQSTWQTGGVSNSDYGEKTNWDTGTPPIVGGDAIFGNAGSTSIVVPPPLIAPGTWTFTPDAQDGYTFSGSDVFFSTSGNTGGIINNSNAGQTITIQNNIGEVVPGVQVQQLGNSTLILNGTNTFSGGTLISAGTLQAGTESALGSGTVTFDGGTFKVDSAIVPGGPNPFPTFNNNVIVNTPGGTVDNNGISLALAGTISDGSLTPGELRFIDSTNGPAPTFPYAGLTILSGDNSGFTGGIRIVETNLRAENALAAGAGPITLDGGTFLAGDTMTVNNTFRLINNANANANIIDNKGNVLTIAGKIVDADPLHPGAVTFADASGGFGLTILTNQSIYTGGTIVCSCTTLQLGTTTTAGGIVGVVTVEGTLNVVNSDTTGITSITNQFGGVTNFRVSSTASAMTINNDTGGRTNFLNNSTAGNATINNILGGGGTITFNTFSTGGTATINNAGGDVFFNDRTTLASGHINNTDGGLVVFSSQSSAGGPLATIVNSGDDGFFSSEVRFNDRSTAGSATITNRDGAILDFNSRASAGTATIINSSVNGAWFYDQSSAANAFITTNAGAGTFFFNRSNGDAAQFLTNTGGTVDFSQTRGQNTDRKITAGSIAGAGDYYLGGNQLTVGSNNLSTEVSGTINDGVSPLLQALACGCGLAFNTGASLVKIGTGTLILSGANTYTGGTTISGGTLQLGNGGSTGSILGDVVNNSVLAFNHSDTFTFAGLISGSGQVTQLGPGTLVLSGANSYSGGTTVAGGVLSIGADNNIGTGPLALLNGAGLMFTNSFNFTHPVTVAGDPIFDTAAGLTVTMAGVIADGATPGDVVKTGGGSLVLAAANSYSAGTLVNGGILQLGAGGSLAPTGALTVNTGGTFDLNGHTQTVGDFSGAGLVTLGSGALTAGGSNATTFSGVISGTGSFTKAGTGALILSGANNYSGGTTVAGGVLSIGANNNIGTGPLALLNGAGLQFTNSFTFNHPTTVAGDPTFDTATGITVTIASVIADGEQTGDVVKAGGGSLVLAAANTYTAGTVVNSGILQLGAGGSLAPTGALTVNTGGTFDLNGHTQTVGDFSGGGLVTLGSGALTAGGSNATTFSGVISGTGSFTKAGTGALTLAGTSTYTGSTNAAAGSLIVNGSISASSLLTIMNGGLVGGTGILPSVIVSNGGTLSPGNSIGTISVAGNLMFSPSSLYLVEVSPTAADRTNVTGTASLAGTVQATFASGSYVTHTYTILSASGGRSGTFGVFTATGFPSGFLPSLSYTGTDVILNLTAVLGQTTTTTTTTTTTGAAARPSVSNGGLAQNPFNVATALNTFFNNGGALPADFLPLFGLTGGNLSTALSQLSGETATGIAPAGLEAQNRFLMLMLDPFAGVGEAAGATSMRATSFATDEAASDDLTLGYAGQPRAAIRLPVKAPPLEAAAAPDRRWSAWASTYGSESRARGDAATGSHDRDVRTGNIASGFDYRFSPDTTVGFAFSGGSASYGLSDGLGSGRGDVYQAGAYVASRWQSFYVAASAALSRYELSESRTIAFPGALTALSGNTAANAIGARFEAGKRYDYAGYGLTPYGALQTQSIRTPGFNEAANAGSSAFALSYAAQTTTRTRSEIGVGADHRVVDFAGGNITGFGRAAWGHEFNRDATINPVFTALPGASFNIQGAQAAGDSALLSAGLLWANSNGWSMRLKGDGEFASSVTTYAGNATLRYMW